MRTTIALSLLLLAGCSSVSNVQDLADVGQSIDIKVPGNWQMAYRTLDARMQQCFNRNNLLGGNMAQVHGQLYDELRMGEITATMQAGPFRQSPYVSLEVRPDGDNSTVKLTSRKAWFGDMQQLVRIWTTNSSTACRP
jgi:hypothetical protein